LKFAYRHVKIAWNIGPVDSNLVNTPAKVGTKILTPGVKLGRSPPEPGSPTYDLGSTTCNRSSTTSK